MILYMVAVGNFRSERNAILVYILCINKIFGKNLYDVAFHKSTCYICATNVYSEKAV